MMKLLIVGAILTAHIEPWLVYFSSFTQKVWRTVTMVLKTRLY